ncbi:MAG: MGMT family protein [Candidatus Verstraetearchaeota archaeon]|nr:MGMT family protein [Candidatus Verstraetearchaeota archaeon]
MGKRKSWTEKLNDVGDLPKVVKIEGKMTRRWGEGTVVIPSPREVYDLMRSVPEGKLTTINEIRSALARRHAATICCPITAGIFAWVSANASEEERAAGGEGIPYWRTLKSGGVVNEKYPGGVEIQKALLEKEGHRLVRKGTKNVSHRVLDLEKSLYAP